MVGHRVRAMFIVTVLLFWAIATPLSATAAPTTWRVVPSPDPGAYNGLAAVSCVTPRSCVAVGFSQTNSPGSRSRTLVESFDGTRWTVVPSPNRGTDHNNLSGVSCVTPNFCVAVGYYLDTAATAYRTLVETWDGKTWKIATTPNPGSADFLNAVSCATARSCVAVGSNDYGTLVETWDGSTWSAAAPPNPAVDGILLGVSCTRPRSCVAVGLLIGAGGVWRTLAETLDGTTLRLSTSRDVGGNNNLLRGVSCTKPTACVAVGNYGLFERTLVEGWDGTRWSVIPSPNQGTTNNEPSAVSCATARSCVAVGGFVADDLGDFGTLVLTWDGKTWTVAASPSPATDNGLGGVSCSTKRSCVAVGVATDRTKPNTENTLIVCGSPPPSADSRSQPCNGSRTK